MKTQIYRPNKDAWYVIEFSVVFFLSIFCIELKPFHFIDAVVPTGGTMFSDRKQTSLDTKEKCKNNSQFFL